MERSIYYLPTYLPTYLGAVISFSAIVCDDKPIKSQMMSLRMIPIEKNPQIWRGILESFAMAFSIFWVVSLFPVFRTKAKMFSLGLKFSVHFIGRHSVCMTDSLTLFLSTRGIEARSRNYGSRRGCVVREKAARTPGETGPGRTEMNPNSATRWLDYLIIYNSEKSLKWHTQFAKIDSKFWPILNKFSNKSQTL